MKRGKRIYSRAAVIMANLGVRAPAALDMLSCFYSHLTTSWLFQANTPCPDHFMAATYDRSMILEILGPDALTNVLKAEQHFGERIQLEEAINWIFNGCPDYKEPAVVDNSKALVKSEPSGPLGWEDKEKPPSYSGLKDASQDWGALDSIPAVDPETAKRDTQAQWAGFVPRPLKEDDGSDSASSKDRAGHNTPTEGTEGSASRPVDLSAFSSDASGHVNDEDAELQKALALSMQDTGARGSSRGAYDVGSRASKIQQEDEDMQAAMRASIVEHMSKASSVHGKNVEETDPLLKQIRSDLSHPLALKTPTIFTSFIPAVLQILYHNVPFRSVVLALEFPWIRPPTYEGFSTDSPSPDDMTRALLPAGTDLSVIKMASLQRIFAYMRASRRSKSAIHDFLDAHRDQVDGFVEQGQKGSPVLTIRILFQSIVEAYDTCVRLQMEQQQQAGEFTDASTNEAKVEQYRRVMSARGVDGPRALKESIEAGEAVDGRESAWISVLEAQAYPTDRWDSYSVIEAYMHNDKVRQARLLMCSVIRHANASASSIKHI